MINDRPNRPSINRNTIIWRYLGESAVERLFKPIDKKFIRNSYSFSRIDTFSDLREGRFSPSQLASQVATLKLHTGWPEDNTRVAEHIISIINMSEQSRTCLGVSCWFADIHENAAMWDRYAKNGVAIKSTIGQLISSLEITPHFGWIGFADYSHKLGEWDMLDSAFNKSIEFKDEKEIRVVIAKTGNPNSSYSSSGPGNRVIEKYPKVKVNWESLIEKIIFSPTLDEYRKLAWEKEFINIFPNIKISSSVLSQGYRYMLHHSDKTLSNVIVDTIEQSKNVQEIAHKLNAKLDNDKN
jgi:hypothetical protein